MKLDPLLQGQIEYYRARAAEYDDWIYRRGRYFRGEAHRSKWFVEQDIVRKALFAAGPVNEALELACGTGLWTQELVKISARVTALDASAEVIAINREKVGGGPVEYEQADLFAWEADRQYDLVFAGFWLSHVPPPMFSDFLRKVNRCLKPGGNFLAVDSLRNATSTAIDHELGQDNGNVQTRILRDGREFEIVKVFYDLDALRGALEGAGFEADVSATGEFFWYAHAKKTPATAPRGKRGRPQTGK